MQIIVSIPEDDFESYEEEQYDVLPCDSVDILMREFAILDDLNVEGMSTIVEQAFIKGEFLRYEDSQTFLDCDFMEGDTIHFGLAPKELHLIVHNFATNLQVHMGVPSLYTLGKLKTILHLDYPQVYGSSFIPYPQIIFKHHNQSLLERLTLADCNFKNLDTLYIDVIRYEIFVAIPAFEKIMERLVFRPSDTIGTIKDTVAEIHQSRYLVVLKSDIVSVVLRGAIQNKKGTLVYVCLHLFHTQMLVHMDESTEESSQPGYFCVLNRINTVRDIYRMVDKEDGYTLNFTPPAVKDKWSETACIFDYTWSKTFAPQMDMDPVTWSDDKHLPLYFFPCVPRTRCMDEVSSLCTVRNFVESVLEQEDMKGVDRTLCKLETGKPFAGWQTLFSFNKFFKSKAFVVLRKSISPIYERRMKVYVTWSGRPKHSPIECIVEPDDTVVSLKDRIENLLKVPISMQKLFFSGKTLAVNSALLSSVGIEENSIVEVLPNLEDESITTCNDKENNNITTKQ